MRLNKEVPPAVGAAFGRTMKYFGGIFISNNLAENINSVLSAHLKLTGPKSKDSAENRIRTFFLYYNQPNLLGNIALKHKFQVKFVINQLKSNPWAGVLCT